jgi:hypothetical protein
MKVSFNKPGRPAATETIPAAEAVQDNGNTAVALREPTPPPAPFRGDEEVDMKEVILPRINIVQKVGELSDRFTPGEIVLNSDLVLPKPLRILVLGFAPKAFVEKVEGGGRGQIFHSEAEVVAAGGTLDWNEAKSTKKPLYQKLDKVLLLLECPAGIDPLHFPYEREGKNYAIISWNLKGSGYTYGAKIFKTARKLGVLRNGYRMAWWSLETEKKVNEGNTYYVPKLKATETTTQEFREWVASDSVVGF